jgi:hypothetical protein
MYILLLMIAERNLKERRESLERGEMHLPHKPKLSVHVCTKNHENGNQVSRFLSPEPEVVEN